MVYGIPGVSLIVTRHDLVSTIHVAQTRLFATARPFWPLGRWQEHSTHPSLCRVSRQIWLQHLPYPVFFLFFLLSLISCLDTTRSPRPGEVDGKQYHFVTTQCFRELIQQSAFIEHAEFSGNLYGTSFETVRSVQELGRRCILDIDAQVGLPL